MLGGGEALISVLELFQGLLLLLLLLLLYEVKHC
jgi:hypothetical protein